MSKVLLGALIAITFALPFPAWAQLTWGPGGAGGTGTWTSSNTNWYNGTSNVAWIPGGTGTFTANSQTGYGVTVSGTQTVSQLNFVIGFNGLNYTLNGGTLQTASGGLVINSTGSSSFGEIIIIYSPIVGGSVTLGARSTIGLFGQNTYSGGTTISTGARLNAQDPGSLGSGGIVDNGFLHFFSSGTLQNVVSGTGRIQLDTGTISLDAANTYSGGTDLIPFFSTSATTNIVTRSTVLTTAAGITKISNGPFGSGILSLNQTGGQGLVTFEDNGTDITLANSVALIGNIIFGSTGTGSLNFDGTALTTSSTVTLKGSVNLTVNNTTTIANPISGNYAITLGGTGTLILTGTNTSTAGLSITSGTLLANNSKGSATGSGAFTLSSGANLGGTGKISSTTNLISGTVQGGASGLNTTGSLTLTSSGTTTFDSTANLVFNLAAAGTSNELNVANSAVLFSGSTLTLNLVDSSSTDYASGLQYVLIAANGDVNQFSGITVDGSNHIIGLNLTLTGTATNGQQDSVVYGNSFLALNNGNIVVQIQAVPEPGTWALLLSGLAFLVFWKGRRKFPRQSSY